MVTDDGDAYFCRDNVKAPGQSSEWMSKPCLKKPWDAYAKIIRASLETS